MPDNNGDLISRIRELGELRKKGVLTEEEFQQAKKIILETDIEPTRDNSPSVVENQIPKANTKEPSIMKLVIGCLVAIFVALSLLELIHTILSH
jgi:hypothetical protein